MSVFPVGHETKAMKNNNGPRYKRSELERLMNWDVVWCVVILLVLIIGPRQGQSDQEPRLIAAVVLAANGEHI